MSALIGYAVIVEQADDGGFGAWSPDLPGCVALGDTVDECLEEMRDAMGLYIEVLQERGEDVPAPRANRTANPAPPASGDQYAMARTAGRNSWAQAFDSQGGSGQTSHTSTATTTFSVSINIPFEWPQPAQINGYANPSFLGGHAVLSRTSPLTLGQSAANSRNRIRFGAARDSIYSWLNLWDTSLSRNDGTEWLEYWTWPGLEDGYAFYVNIDATPAHVYHFNLQTITSATSSPIFGGPAAAQTDYGSAGLDAPALGEGLHILSNDFDDMAIEYLMPPGWTVTC